MEQNQIEPLTIACDEELKAKARANGLTGAQCAAALRPGPKAAQRLAKSYGEFLQRKDKSQTFEEWSQ